MHIRFPFVIVNTLEAVPRHLGQVLSRHASTKAAKAALPRVSRGMVYLYVVRGSLDVCKVATSVDVGDIIVVGPDDVIMSDDEEKKTSARMVDLHRRGTAERHRLNMRELSTLLEPPNPPSERKENDQSQ